MSVGCDLNGDCSYCILSLVQLKDLKRQLHQERKRGDRLQERLQEYLTADNRSKTCQWGDGGV